MAKLKIAKRYGVIPNDILNDNTLTLKAKGLWVFIQSKPENWSFSANKITAQTKDGKDGISAGLKELEEHGLLARIRGDNSKGQWDINYVLAEKPLTEKPLTEKPLTEKPSTIVIKKESNKEFSKKEPSSCEQGSREIVKIIKAFEVVNPSYEKMFGNTTQRAACERLLKKWSFEEVTAIIGVLPKLNADQYARGKSITPLQMEDNLGYIKSYLDQHNSKRIKRYEESHK